MQVAFLGLGRMGSRMARHVLTGGHSLRVWNRTPGRAAELVAAGATESPTPADAARGADAVVLALFDPESVREVLHGPDGVLAGAAPGTVVVNTTTVGPRAAVEAASACLGAGLGYVDAPVMGSVGPAEQGMLGVLVGGELEDVARVRPLLEAWGDPARIHHLGPVGNGSAAKLVVNLTIGVAMEGVGEALRLAGDFGLPRDTVLDLISAGPLGWTVTNKRAVLEQGPTAEAAFTLDALVKDLALAVHAARRGLPAARAAMLVGRKASREGLGDADHAAMAWWLEHLDGDTY
jgi:3-hydroxyisobutyrate dehydrogenase-like beta-hydroxyacid dehydrogenase